MPEKTTTHFALAIKSYLERTERRANDLERSARIPNASIAHIMHGSRPSPARVGEILAAIPPAEAAEILRAYLTDDVPENWREAVQIIITTLGDSIAAPVSARHADSLTAALDALGKAARGDIDLAAWLVDTAAILRLTGDTAAPAEEDEPDLSSHKITSIHTAEGQKGLYQLENPNAPPEELPRAAEHTD